MEGPPGPPIEHRLDYSKFIISTALNFLLLLSLFMLNFKLYKSNIQENQKIIWVIALSLMLTIVFSFLATHLQMMILDPPPGDFHRPMKGTFFHDIFMMSIAAFVSQILYLTQKKQQIALKYETLEAENMKIRYETLKNQIDPHFFFNTLSTLYFLIETDAKKAQEYIHKFSSVFRYTLQNRESVSLQEEIHFTKDYASLIQIRYGDQLNIVFELDEKYYVYEVVPLSIQTLVENAIKHNIISNKQPLTISIRTNPDESVTVFNNLQQKETAEPGEGIGLSNLSERYHLKWQKHIIIKNDGETFSVTVPLINPKQIML